MGKRIYQFKESFSVGVDLFDDLVCFVKPAYGKVYDGQTSFYFTEKRDDNSLDFLQEWDL